MIELVKLIRQVIKGFIVLFLIGGIMVAMTGCTVPERISKSAQEFANGIDKLDKAIDTLEQDTTLKEVNDDLKESREDIKRGLQILIEGKAPQTEQVSAVGSGGTTVEQQIEILQTLLGSEVVEDRQAGQALLAAMEAIPAEGQPEESCGSRCKNECSASGLVVQCVVACAINPSCEPHCCACNTQFGCEKCSGGKFCNRGEEDCDDSTGSTDTRHGSSDAANAEYEQATANAREAG